MAKPKWELQQEVRNPIYLLSLDGVNTELFYKMLDNGQLPNVKQAFFDRQVIGTRDGLCGIPAVTPFCHETYTTGKFSVHPGLKWYNRTKKRVVDYGADMNLAGMEHDTCERYTTIYEILGGGTTVTEFANKGADHKFRKRIWMKAVFGGLRLKFMHRLFNKVYGRNHPTRYVTNYAMSIDRVSTKRVLKILKKAKKKPQTLPKILTDWKWGIDEVAHREGVTNGALEESYALIDKYLGQTMNALADTGRLDDYLCVLLSDHNTIPVREDGNRSLTEMLKSFGCDPKTRRTDFTYDVKGVYFGDAVAYIYDADNKHAGISRFEDMVNKFAQDESTDLVIVRGDVKNEIIFARGDRRATMHFEERDGVMHYRMNGGSAYRGNNESNIFDYSPEAHAAMREWHTAEQNLAATYAEQNPWVLPTIQTILSDDKSPEIIAITKEGYDYSGKDLDKISRFRFIKRNIVNANLRSGHGHITQQSRKVPLIFSSTNPHNLAGWAQDPFGDVPYGTLADVVPTILDLVCEDKSELERYFFDGRSLCTRNQ